MLQGVRLQQKQHLRIEIQVETIRDRINIFS